MAAPRPPTSCSRSSSTAATAARGVRAAAVHPGGIQTELARHLEPEALNQLLAATDAERAAQGLPPYRLKTVAQGAATSVWAGVVAPAEEVGGRYCEDCHVTTRVTDGPITVASGGVRPYALDPEHAQGALGQERGAGRRALLGRRIRPDGTDVADLNRAGTPRRGPGLKVRIG